MKLSIVKYITVSLLVAAAVASCKKPGDFGDLNTDPNNPSDPNTALLLTSAIRSGLSTGNGAVTAADPLLYVQHLSEVVYTQASTYTSRIFDYNGLYNGSLNDLVTIINLNTDPATKSKAYVLAGGSNANQIAVARILKAFQMMQMADRWGDIPYSAAFQGIKDITPEFDRQEDVYKAVFTELKEAVAGMDNGAGPTGDILLGGDLNWWKQWAVSIRMILALRLEKASPATAKAEFAAAFAEGGLTSNHSVFYKYLSDANNQNPWYNNYNIGKRYDYAISEKMVNSLKALNDPRLPVFADTTSSGTYKGMVYGLKSPPTGTSTGTVDAPGTISLIGKAFRQQNSKAAVTTYAQMQFAIAEAAHLGWIAGGEAAAETYYLAGIKASLEQFGVGDAYAAYIAQPAVAYNAAKAVELIQTQKWIAGYLGNGYEAWAEWRRTGFPVLTAAPDAAPVSGGKIPRRQAYPTTERDLNTENYNKVVERQGADELTTRTWVDPQ